MCLFSPSQLTFGNTLVPAIRMVRLQNAAPSIFTQELAEMVFGQTTLGTQSLKGSTFGVGKEPLHKETVDDIIGEDVCTWPC